VATKPTKAYKHLTLPYLINIAHLLHVHVLATLVAILREVSTKDILQKLLRTNANAYEPHSPLSLSVFDSRRGYSPPNNINSAYVVNIILTTVSHTC
jgi:hypothetical protein